MLVSVCMKVCFQATKEGGKRGDALNTTFAMQITAYSTNLLCLPPWKVICATEGFVSCPAPDIALV